MRRPLRRAAGVLVTVVTAGTVLAGCAADTLGQTDPPTTTAVLPTPPGASFGAQPPEGVEASSCDATSSLRPSSTFAPGQMPSGSTMERIFQRGRLVVGTDIGSNPLSFRDPISGDIEGFDLDIATWLADAIFGEPKIEYRILTTDERLSALQNGEVDVVVKSMSITCDRRKAVEFSEPYLTAGQRILAYRNSGINDVADLKGKNVCATQRSTALARIQTEVPAARPVSASSWADCQVMMQQGQVDAIVGDEPILVGLAEQDPWVQMVGDSIGTEYYGVGIPLQQDDMVRFVNAVLEQRRGDGSWQQSQQHWLPDLAGSPPPTSYRD
ncbi:MAG: glutamate ABC transporter substrate-binding protein [Gordonia sp. (in: high G+C Gram-positive bacteria)]|uniref:glutamate ABC transporter substrate-binding protein n=1 Tax=Gordonia sp. (in: high G+C Gram-positive bacteria) TaxID=84139 RepID=UPI0039E3AEAE